MSTSLDDLDPTIPPSGTGCAECEATGGWWVHLRRCAECGHVGCCDSSPSQHATAHFTATGHRYMRSFEPGEAWWWDYEEGRGFEPGPHLVDPQNRPESQAAPGPAERLPENWAELIHR